MSNNIINHRLLVQSRIKKSFQSDGLSMKDVKNTEDIFKSVTPDFLSNEKMADLVPLSKAEQVEALSDGEFEKAHNDGDIHPNHPDWVWVSSANKGRGDWRKINGRAHKAHGEYRDKFNATFKDADEKILQKIISGEIQGTAHDKQLAKKMLEDRKSSKVKTSEQEYDDASFSDKVAINLKNENPKYSDKSKITFEDNNNGKYKIMYDGEYTKLLISKDKVDEADAKKAGFINDKSDDKLDKKNNNKKISDLKKGDEIAVIKYYKNKQKVEILKSKIQNVNDKTFGVFGHLFDKETGESTTSRGNIKYSIVIPNELKKLIKDKKFNGIEISGENPFDDSNKLSSSEVYYKTLAERFDETGKCKTTDTLIGVYKNNPSKNVEAARAFRKYIMNDLNYIDNNDWQKTLNEYKKLRLNANKEGDKDAYKAYDCAYQAVKDRIAKDAKNKDNDSTKKTTTRDNLVEALKIPSKIFDEDTRKNDYGKWYEAVTAYEQKGASAIGSAIGKTFKKDFYGYLSTRLGEYRSKDGGTAVTIKVAYDTGLRTHINHSQVQTVSRDVRGGLRLSIEFPYDNTTKSLNLSEMNEKELNNLVSALKKIDSFKIADTSKMHGSTISEKTENYVKSVLSKLTNNGSVTRGDKNEPAVKYSGMTAAQANKTLVGKTIKIGDKTAKIMNAFKSSVGSNKVYLEVVDGDDYLGKYMQISLDAVDSGKTKYDNKYFGTKGQKIEISDEKPDKKEVTKESFKEFLDYMQKNIAKKDSNEFLNKEYMFLFTVPKKYRSSAGNVHNRVAATIKKLSDANNW